MTKQIEPPPEQLLFRPFSIPNPPSQILRTTETETSFTISLSAPSICHLLIENMDDSLFGEPEIEPTIEYELVREGAPVLIETAEERAQSGQMEGEGKLRVKVFYEVPFLTGLTGLAGEMTDIHGMRQYEIPVPGKYYELPLDLRWQEDDEYVFVFAP